MNRLQFMEYLKIRSTGLYYFSYIDNANKIINGVDIKLNNNSSIKFKGLLSYNILEKNNIIHETFAEETVQERRHNKIVTLSDGNIYTGHDLVPLYYTSTTPTYFAIHHDYGDIFFIEIDWKILLDKNIIFCFTDGNLASHNSEIYNTLEDVDKIPFDVINSNNMDAESKRQRNSELLILNSIPIKYFKRIAVVGPIALSKLAHKLGIDDYEQSKIKIEIDPSLF